MSHDPAAVENLFVELFLEAHRQPPRQIVLDLDATDDPLLEQLAPPVGMPPRQSGPKLAVTAWVRETIVRARLARRKKSVPPQ